MRIVPVHQCQYHGGIVGEHILWVNGIFIEKISISFIIPSIDICGVIAEHISFPVIELCKLLADDLDCIKCGLRFLFIVEKSSIKNKDQ